MSRLKKGGIIGGVAAAMAIALVGKWEGVSTTAYRDIVGIPTVCFGETRGVKMGDRYTLEECKAKLGDALLEYEAKMRACLDAPDRIPDGAYVAFLSLSYNIGTGAFCRSTVAARANRGDLVGACNALPWFNKAGGRVVQGLANRRAEEQRMCLDSLQAPAS